jgi:hypothetical protein
MPVSCYFYFFKKKQIDEAVPDFEIALLIKDTFLAVLDLYLPVLVCKHGSANLCQSLWSSSQEFLATAPEVRIRFPALPDSLRSSGSGTGFTQPREYN